MIMFRDRELVSLPERFLTDIRRQTPGFLCLPLISINFVLMLANVMDLHLPPAPGPIP